MKTERNEEREKREKRKEREEPSVFGEEADVSGILAKVHP